MGVKAFWPGFGQQLHRGQALAVDEGGHQEQAPAHKTTQTTWEPGARR
jgi:hypothetical protein